jgi:hypothetical protein
MAEIEIGQYWRDVDIRGSYNVTPDGTYPIPDDYEGLIHLAPRIVEITDVNDAYVSIKNLHNGKGSQIKRSRFLANSTGRRGFVRAQVRT